MISVFLFFIIVSLLMLYGVWFLPQDGKMLSTPERGCLSMFISLFLGVGICGVYWIFYVPEPIKTATFAGKILDWYDANKNGKIERKRESRVIHCESSISCRTYSYYTLFEDADKNKDSVTTWQELEVIIKLFDQDKNGKIDYRTESIKFYKAYPQYMSNGFRSEYVSSKEDPLVK